MRTKGERTEGRQAARPRAWTGRALVAAGLLLVPGVMAGVSGDAGTALEEVVDAYGLRESFRDHALQAMDPYLFRAQLATGAMDLTLRGKDYRVLVEPAPWEGSYKVGRVRADGTVATEAPLFASVVYLGRVAGDAGSFAYFVVTGTGVQGSVRTAADYVLFEPARFHSPAAPPGVSVVYHAFDAIAPPDDLHHEREPFLPLDAPGPAPEEGIAAMGYGGPNREIMLWYDADMKEGTAYLDKMWSVFNHVNAEWSSALGWFFTVTQGTLHECPATPCLSTNKDVLLDDFSNYVHAGGSWSSYELAHLFTGKDLPIYGLANQPGRYGYTHARLLGNYYAALVLAHELGHNFNARHQRQEAYTHMHGAVAKKHSTLMSALAHLPEANLEQHFEFSSANENWVQACNRQSWTQGSKAPGAASTYGNRCWTGVVLLANGGAGASFDGTNYRGKYFPNAALGSVYEVCAWFEQGGTTVDLAFKAQPTASSPVVFTTSITANAAGKACTNPDKDWPATTLFVYKTGGTARIAYDTSAPYDGRWSADGVSWASDNVRRGYSVSMYANTLPVDSCGALAPGASLAVHGNFVSCNGQYMLAHQGDGNVVLYKGTQPLWATGTSGATTTLAMQGDGNLVLYNGGTVRWASNTQGNPGAWLSVRDDGLLVMYSANGTRLWYQGCGILPPDGGIPRGGNLKSCDARFTLAHQGDGNVVLYQGATVLWATGTQGQGTTSLNMQGDGNLVLYDGATVRWASGTSGHPRSHLLLRDDGNLVIKTSYREIVWQTGTGGH